MGSVGILYVDLAQKVSKLLDVRTSGQTIPLVRRKAPFQHVFQTSDGSTELQSCLIDGGQT